MAQLVARSSGVGLYECGAELWVVPAQTGGLHVAAFVTGLLAFIGVANGIVQLAMRNVVVGAAILGGALVPGVICALLVSAIRRRHARAPEARDALVILDLSARKLLDNERRPLADFAQVKLERRFQLGSSSPALAVEWPGGSIIAVRGSPFAGGVDDVESRLRSAIGAA